MPIRALDGIKTGYTVAAGFNLVSSAQRGDNGHRRGDGGKIQRPAQCRGGAPDGSGLRPHARSGRGDPALPLRTTAAAALQPAPARPSSSRRLRLSLRAGRLADASGAPLLPAARGSTVAALVAQGVSATASPDGSIRPLPRVSADARSPETASIAAVVAEVNSSSPPPAAQSQILPRSPPAGRRARCPTRWPTRHRARATVGSPRPLPPWRRLRPRRRSGDHHGQCRARHHQRWQ